METSAAVSWRKSSQDPKILDPMAMSAVWDAQFPEKKTTGSVRLQYRAQKEGCQYAEEKLALAWFSAQI